MTQASSLATPGSFEPGSCALCFRRNSFRVLSMLARGVVCDGAAGLAMAVGASEGELSGISAAGGFAAACALLGRRPVIGPRGVRMTEDRDPGATSTRVGSTARRTTATVPTTQRLAIAALLIQKMSPAAAGTKTRRWTREADLRRESLGKGRDGRPTRRASRTPCGAEGSSRQRVGGIIADLRRSGFCPRLPPPARARGLERKPVAQCGDASKRYRSGWRAFRRSFRTALHRSRT